MPRQKMLALIQRFTSRNGEASTNEKYHRDRNPPFEIEYQTLKDMSIPHHLWRQLLCSNAIINYKNENLRQVLNRKSKDAFKDFLHFECTACAAQRTARNSNSTDNSQVRESIQTLHFHHKYKKTLYVGSFRVVKDPVKRRTYMNRIVRELGNICLLCVDHHRDAHR